MSFFSYGKRKPDNSKITFTNPEAAKAAIDRKTEESNKQLAVKRARLDAMEKITTNSQQEEEVPSTSTANNTTVNTAENSENNNDKLTIDWSVDAMQLDKENSLQSGNFEKDLETLKNPAAEVASTSQSSTATEKGKSPEKGTNEEDFIRIPRVTRYFATVPADKIDGDTPDKKIVTLQKIFTVTAGFLGAKHFPGKKVLAVYFDHEYSLGKAINWDKETHKLSEPRFTIANSKEKRSNEADRSIKITDIPLDTKSEVVKACFSQFGNITRFSMDTRGLWQTAYITYDCRDAIVPFHNKWSFPIMDYFVRVYPMNLNNDQLEARSAYTLKLTGFPFNTTHKELEHIIIESDAMSCFIPKASRSYKNMRYAYVSFISEEAAKKAFDFEKIYAIKGSRLFWVHPRTPTCFKCASPQHQTKDCKDTGRKFNRNRSHVDKLYEKFRPAQYRAKPQYYRNRFASSNNSSSS